MPDQMTREQMLAELSGDHSHEMTREQMIAELNGDNKSPSFVQMMSDEGGRLKGVIRGANQFVENLPVVGGPAQAIAAAVTPGDFSENLANRRRWNQEFRNENPHTDTLLSMGGAAATPMPAWKAAQGIGGAALNAAKTAGWIGAQTAADSSLRGGTTENGVYSGLESIPSTLAMSAAHGTLQGIGNLGGGLTGVPRDIREEYKARAPQINKLDPTIEANRLSDQVNKQFINPDDRAQANLDAAKKTFDESLVQHREDAKKRALADRALISDITTQGYVPAQQKIKDVVRQSHEALDKDNVTVDMPRVKDYLTSRMNSMSQEIPDNAINYTEPGQRVPLPDKKTSFKTLQGIREEMDNFPPEASGQVGKSFSKIAAKGAMPTFQAPDGTHVPYDPVEMARLKKFIDRGYLYKQSQEYKDLSFEAQRRIRAKTGMEDKIGTDPANMATNLEQLHRRPEALDAIKTFDEQNGTQFAKDPRLVQMMEERSKSTDQKKGEADYLKRSTGYNLEKSRADLAGEEADPYRGLSTPGKAQSYLFNAGQDVPNLDIKYALQGLSKPTLPSGAENPVGTDWNQTARDLRVKNEFQPKHKEGIGKEIIGGIVHPTPYEAARLTKNAVSDKATGVYKAWVDAQHANPAGFVSIGSKMVAKAAEKGPHAFAVAHSILLNRDPEYKKEWETAMQSMGVFGKDVYESLGGQ